MKVTFYANVELSALSVVQFYKVDLDILRDLGYEVKIVNSYRNIDWSSDIIFIWWWTYAFIPVVIGKLLGKKTIITGTFNYRAPESPVDYFRRPFWQKFLIKYAMKFASKNVLVSKNEFEQISHDWKFKNLYYSPHVINTSKYFPDKNLKRDKFIFTIIWTGKLNIIRKCLPEIFSAAKILKKKLPDIKFLVAGRKGDGFELAQDLIKKNNLENNFFLLGEISESEKIRYLQTCAIYLQPTKYEGFGLAIAEAMACGAPVITSDAGEVKNVVGDCGVILKGHEPADIVEAVESLMDNEKYLIELSEKAVSRIKTYFNFDRRKNDLQKILNE